MARYVSLHRHLPVIKLFRREKDIIKKLLIFSVLLSLLLFGCEKEKKNNQTTAKPVPVETAEVKINPAETHLDPDLTEQVKDRDVIKGIGYFNEKQYKKAIEEFQKILKKNNEDSEAYYSALCVLANVCYNLKKYEESVKYYTLAAKHRPDDSLNYFYLGLIYHSQNKLNLAIKNFQKSIALNPGKFQSYYNLGNIYKDKENYEKALEYYKKSLEIEPNNLNAFYNMGNVYYKSGDIKNSNECYLKAIEINPAHGDSHYNLGLNYQEKGEYDKAIGQFNELLKINPSYREVYYDLGVTYYNLKDSGQALKNFNIYIEQHKNDTDNPWIEKAHDYIEKIKETK